jgi:hypothetical protein
VAIERLDLGGEERVVLEQQVDVATHDRRELDGDEPGLAGPGVEI